MAFSSSCIQNAILFCSEISSECDSGKGVSPRQLVFDDEDDEEGVKGVKGVGGTEESNLPTPPPTPPSSQAESTSSRPLETDM